ncbi:hypothetical protein [Tessaracoccus flavus]|uniref:Uncharacterized protein n=1 Tax=Tessaracoccus flavus TaxID=1610493 RepID=A0A1Q2CC07_9ACTN|nr:hypothetical protein [Tessaracoccus flavus]AQP43644.1 hypothetical protein RPIT_01460 [Tessaracoccus flavus]SDZ01704.1 hypothetical protein SAMN05428934_10840 [Tessaracoccus flavus]
MGKKVKGALRLDVPFSSDAPQLTSGAVGLPRIVKHPGQSCEVTVTVLDAPDARLQRAGVTVAHRVVDGRGEWLLSAPGWGPALPESRVEPVGASGDLPDDFTRLIRPILRRGVLGTLATLELERDEWALRSEEGEDAALVRDERVTVTRSGMITSRYREIEITPTGLLTGQQREFLLSSGLAVGATVVDAFPSAQSRIGAPATGLTSFPRPRDPGPDATLEEYVSAVFTRHLDQIVRAELARRAGDGDVAHVDALLWAFGRDLRGLASVLEPSWREDIERALDGLPFTSPADIEAPVLDVIEALVGAARAPQLGDLAHEPAARVLFDKAEQATVILAERCRGLAVDSPDEVWHGALRAAEQLEVVLEVAAPVLPKGRDRMARMLGEVTEGLRRGALGAFVGDPELDGLSAAQAYQLGRETERKRAGIADVRQEFVDRWPELFREARKLVDKARRRRERKR